MRMIASSTYNLENALQMSILRLSSPLSSVDEGVVFSICFIVKVPTKSNFFRWEAVQVSVS